MLNMQELQTTITDKYVSCKNSRLLGNATSSVDLDLSPVNLAINAVNIYPNVQKCPNAISSLPVICRITGCANAGINVANAPPTIDPMMINGSPLNPQK